jgi:hypothetical protein
MVIRRISNRTWPAALGRASLWVAITRPQSAAALKLLTIFQQSSGSRESLLGRSPQDQALDESGPAVLWSFGPLAGGLLGSLDLRTIEACALISCESAAA